MSAVFIPYCGQAPVPGALAWNTDPILISVLGAIGLAYAFGCTRAGAPTRRAQGFFALGLAIGAAALLSPLCNLSVALFSARVTQHVLLTLVVAPLIVLGRPQAVLATIFPRKTTRRHSLRGNVGVTTSCLAFAAVMWTWHMPGPYDATLRNNVVYWVMHLTTIGSALMMWHFLLRGGRDHAETAIAAVATGIQMGLLGALLTLAPRELFVVHFLTTSPWGLSPLQDQQLGGVIMWVLADALFTAYAVVAFADGLNDEETRTKSIELAR